MVQHAAVPGADPFDHLPQADVVSIAILRFEDRENPLEFLRAAASLKGSRPGLGFVLIGDGRRASTVREFVEREHLDQVVLPGYLPLSSLPRYYAVADVFVHPAVEECWGLSVNEAMASSVPVVVSTGVGCRFDLLPSSEFGLVYPLGNGKALVEAILALVDDPERARAVAARAKERVAGYGYALAAESFERAVRRARRAPGSATGTEAT